MILGLLTAMIVTLTGVIVPGLTRPLAGLARHMSVYISSVGP